MSKQKTNGVQVDNITFKEPRNSLPQFVREAAEQRGYGDATQPLSLFIQDDDISEAFECAAHGNGSACVMAQAGKRIGAKAVYFYRTTVWVDFGVGPIVRFLTTRSIYENVISPFDDGDRNRVQTGIYHLTPPKGGMSLSGRRASEHTQTKRRKGKADGSRSHVTQAHTDRVVMASRAEV